MKKNKLKVITITFFIILVTMVAFVGVYVQEKNIMENKVKDYSLAMDLNGTRNIVLKVSEETTEVIKDSDGNKVESATDEEISEKGYTKETVQKNTDDVKTLDNYKTSKEIIEKRLKKLGVENYIIKLNEQTGEIVVELTNNSQTDNIVSNLTTVGKFEIIDTNTKEVLLTNDDIKASNVVRSTTSSGTNIYFTIEFNKDGKKKLEEITKTYVPQDNTSSEESSESSENSDSSSQTTKKTITMKIDGTDVMSTDFEEPITDGIMHLSVGQAATDTKTLQENVKQANQMAAVLENKNMPVEYTLQSDTFVKSTVTEDTVAAVIIVVTVIALIALIVLFIRYKSNGLLAIISYVGLVSILLLTIRYTNVVLSIEGIAAIFVILVMNMSIKDMVIKIIPIAILAITFCFMGWIPTSSFGMVMFWGITLIIIYNLLVTKNLLKTSQEK